jgi:hypothetical protein
MQNPNEIFVSTSGKDVATLLSTHSVCEELGRIFVLGQQKN